MVQGPTNKKQNLDKKRYNRLALFYDQFESPMELFNYSRWRAKLRQYLPTNGTILEVGVGTGKNLPFYNKQQRLVAVDVSEKMLLRAKKQSKQAHVNKGFNKNHWCKSSVGCVNGLHVSLWSESYN